MLHRDFRRFWASMVCSGFATQMVSVAVGWQVYAIHRSAFDLGLIGLAEFIPLPLLALPAGELTDRVSRRLVLAVSLALELVVLALFIVVTLAGAHQLWPFLALAAFAGATSALGMPAGRALPAMLVPLELVPSAVTLRSVGFQGAIVTGPAIGGVLFTIDPVVVYATAVGLFVIGLIGVLVLRVEEVEQTNERVDMSTVFAGIRFI